MINEYVLSQYHRSNYLMSTDRLEGVLLLIVAHQKNISSLTRNDTEDTLDLHIQALKQSIQILQKREYLLNLTSSQHKKLQNLFQVLDRSLFYYLRPLFKKEEQLLEKFETKMLVIEFFKTYKKYLAIRRQQSDLFSVRELKEYFVKS